LQSDIFECGKFRSVNFHSCIFRYCIFSTLKDLISEIKGLSGFTFIFKRFQVLDYFPREWLCVIEPMFSRAAAAGTDEHASLSAVTITKTELDATSRRLHVTWNDGEQTSYPYIWLRDNCQSSQSFHASAMTRRLLFHDIDFNVMPQNVEVLVYQYAVAYLWLGLRRGALTCVGWQVIPYGR